MVGLVKKGEIGKRRARIDQPIDIDIVGSIDETAAHDGSAVQEALGPGGVGEQPAIGIAETRADDRQGAGLQTQILWSDIGIGMAVLHLEGEAAAIAGLVGERRPAPVDAKLAARRLIVADVVFGVLIEGLIVEPIV